MEISSGTGPSKFNTAGLYNPNFSGSFEVNRNDFERTPSLGSGESGNFSQSDYDQSTSKYLNFYVFRFKKNHYVKNV